VPLQSLGRATVLQVRNSYVHRVLVEALRAIKRVRELDRERARAGFERRFTARRMAEDYVCHYQILMRFSAVGIFARDRSAVFAWDKLETEQHFPVKAHSLSADQILGNAQ